MTVAELMAKLEQMPSDAVVHTDTDEWFVYDVQEEQNEYFGTIAVLKARDWS